jgi:hypothetical protein
MKLHIIIALCVLSLVLAGCSGSGTYNAKTSKIGTQGLIIELSKSNPKSVYEHEEFGTALFIKNMGSTDVTEENPAMLRVNYDTYRLSSAGGYYDEYRLGLGDYNTLEVPNIILRGKSQYYPVGEDKAAAFYFTSNSLTHLREGAKTEVSYNLCYPYATTMTTMTCIDTKKVTNDASAVACESTPYSGTAGQGAPIVITKIEPEILLQNDYVRPQFKIYIQNVGKGYVTSTQRCGEVNINDRDSLGRVRVEAWLSEEKLECGPDNIGSLKLVDSESFIRCSLPKYDNGYSKLKKNYITPLEIRIDYTYTDIDKIEVEINRNDAYVSETQQGMCNSYEIEYNNKCITKCEYCAAHLGDPICQSNDLNQEFSIGKDFSCSCDLTTCNTKQEKGNCIKGYCPGNSYCCSTNKCDTWQIEYAGQCIDKCYYCSKVNPLDYKLCPQSFNFTNFNCELISKAQCQSAGQACITGYCGGVNTDRYCANINAINII